jgi:hypothetical protein
MKLKQYITELSMRKSTYISSAKYKKESMYEQNIILEDGLEFKFICYYFRTADMWEIAFEDKDEMRHKIERRKGAGVELFAALEKVFKEFINTALPDKFRFSADIEEKSRVKLYELLAKRIEKMGMGFKFEKKQSSAAMIYKFKHWSREK